VRAEPLLSLAATVAGEHRTDNVLAAVGPGLGPSAWSCTSADLASFLLAICVIPVSSVPNALIRHNVFTWQLVLDLRSIPLARLVISSGPFSPNTTAARQGWADRQHGTVGSCRRLAPEANGSYVRIGPPREQIRGFAGHALVHRGKILGVLGVFTREPLYEQDFAWLKMFADQAAVAIANARAFEDLVRAEAAQRERGYNCTAPPPASGRLHASQGWKSVSRSGSGSPATCTTPCCRDFSVPICSSMSPMTVLPADSPAKPLVQHVLDLMKRVSEEGRNAIRSLRSPHPASIVLEEKLSGIREEFSLQETGDFRVVVEGKPIALHPLIREEFTALPVKP